MMTELQRLAQNLNWSKRAELMPLIDYINSELPKDRRVDCFKEGEYDDGEYAESIIYAVDEFGEETGDWGYWLVGPSGENQTFSFMYAGNNEGPKTPVCNTLEEFIEAMKHLEF